MRRWTANSGLEIQTTRKKGNNPNDAPSFEVDMPRWLLNVLLTTIVAVTPLFGQEARPRLRRMSKTELATFLHDLSHDLPNWQARVNQYRSKLDTSYSWDRLVTEAFRMMDDNLASLRDEVKEVSQGETLSGDVSLNSSLEQLGSDLDYIEDLLSAAPPTHEYSSPTLEPVATLWAHTALDVKKEVHGYSLRFFGHTLAAAHEADIALAAGCGKQAAGAGQRANEH